MVFLSWGAPRPESGKGMLEDVGIPSWEGCGPLPLREQSSIPWPAAIQALTILQPRHVDTLIAWCLSGQPPWALSLGTSLPIGPPTWCHPPRTALSRQAPEIWRCSWNSPFCPVPPAPTGAQAQVLVPTPVLFFQEADARLFGSSGGVSDLPTGHTQEGHRLPFLSCPCPSEPPTIVPQPLCCVARAFLGGGAGSPCQAPPLSYWNLQWWGGVSCGKSPLKSK